MTWKTEQPAQTNDLENYASAIQAAKSELDNLSQSIKLAMQEREELVSGNNEILRNKLDEFKERDIETAKRRSKADELHAEAQEKHILINSLSEEVSKNIEEINTKKAELTKSFQEQVSILDLRDKELDEREEQLSSREKELNLSIEKFEKDVSSHEIKVIALNEDAVNQSAKHSELEERNSEIHDTANRLAVQKLEIFKMSSDNQEVLKRIEDIKKDIDAKVKEQADLLEVNKQKEQSIRDLTIEQRRSKVELDKSLEVQRKASNIMQQQKQELEDLKNQIVNHKEGEA